MSDEKTVSEDSEALAEQLEELRQRASLVPDAHLNPSRTHHHLCLEAGAIENAVHRASEELREELTGMLLRAQFHLGVSAGMLDSLTALVRSEVPSVLGDVEKPTDSDLECLTADYLKRGADRIEVVCEAKGGVCHHSRAIKPYEGISFAWFVHLPRPGESDAKEVYGSGLEVSQALFDRAFEREDPLSLRDLKGLLLGQLLNTAKRWWEHPVDNGMMVPTVALAVEG